MNIPQPIVQSFSAQTIFGQPLDCKCQWCQEVLATIVLLENGTIQKICANCRNSYSSKQDRDEYMSDQEDR